MKYVHVVASNLGMTMLNMERMQVSNVMRFIAVGGENGSAMACHGLAKVRQGQRIGIPANN